MQTERLIKALAWHARLNQRSPGMCSKGLHRQLKHWSPSFDNTDNRTDILGSYRAAITPVYSDGGVSRSVRYILSDGRFHCVRLVRIVCLVFDVNILNLYYYDQCQGQVNERRQDLI